MDDTAYNTSLTISYRLVPHHNIPTMEPPALDVLVRQLHEQQSKLTKAREVVRALENEMLKTATQLAHANTGKTSIPARNSSGKGALRKSKGSTHGNFVNNNSDEHEHTSGSEAEGSQAGRSSSDRGGSVRDDSKSTPHHSKMVVAAGGSGRGLIETDSNDTPLRIATAYG